MGALFERQVRSAQASAPAGVNAQAISPLVLSSVFGYNSTINALSASSFAFLYLICHFNAAALKSSTLRTSSDSRRNTPPHIFCNTRSNISYRHEKKRTSRAQLLKANITKLEARRCELEAEQSADSPSSSLSPLRDGPSSLPLTCMCPLPSCSSLTSPTA